MIQSRRAFLKNLPAVAVAGCRPNQRVASGERTQTSKSLGASPARLSDTAPPTSEVIIMNRLAFGPRPDYLAEIAAAGGIDGYIEQQLDPASLADPDCDARLALFGFASLNLPLSQLWQTYRNGDVGNTRLDYIPFYETRTATWLRAVHSKRQLFEVMVDFWHNHFNIYGLQREVRSVWAHYDRDVIRTHALGNFRTFLEAVAQSTAMLYYLDNVFSQNKGPNENYARELFELHTLGAAVYYPEYTIDTVPATFYTNNTGYIDSDVYEAARAFTGWSVANDVQSGGDGTFLYKTDWHDRFQKQVLGQQIINDQPALKDGQDILTWLSAHPATATHVVTKLCRHLIADNPAPAVVAAATTTFLANQNAPDQIKQTVRTILNTTEFRSTWGQKVKRPFTQVVSALRAVAPANATILAPRTDYQEPDPFFAAYSRLGQPLFEWESPTGYPNVAAYWLNVNGLLNRWNFFIKACEVTAQTLPWSIISGIRFNLRAELPTGYITPHQIVDFWIDHLLHRPINKGDREALVAFMTQGADPDTPLTEAQIDERIQGLVALIFTSPYFLEC